ncbi:MAG: glycosyltransferase [Cyclobacteriaceae bacterium]|nr:glycosyltransferase [Cyclobacteriaceae bacterium]
MTNENTFSDKPIVSVVIPCYNHAHYLPDAVQSVREQTYRHTEIIVVDDGSKDHTRDYCLSQSDIIYVYQENQGLSAARNKGIDYARGAFLVFLDADDLLFPEGIEINLQYVLAHPKCGFVSGGHIKSDLISGQPFVEQDYQPVYENHYQALLQGNYIGMHAAVMYQVHVFDDLIYDTSMKACEDYDLYCKIARQYPVVCHDKLIANYRLHSSNMSGNIPLMLENVLKVLDRQRPFIKTSEASIALKRGKKVWKEYYCEQLWKKYHNDEQKKPISHDELLLLLKYDKKKYMKYLLKRSKLYLVYWAESLMPVFLARFLRRKGILNRGILLPNTIDGGHFERFEPFSRSYGFDRGGPIDRFFIERFLRSNAHSVKGRVLEIGDNEYTLMIGGNNVEISDILHVNENNKKATFIGDLSDAPGLPSDAFDCVILTQTLHLIWDVKDALETCKRVLKKGGCLLLTVPGISQIEVGEWATTWYWSFTDRSIKKFMNETFGEGNYELEVFGNAYLASAFLFGAGQGEVDPRFYDLQDPYYQMLICVKAVKH